MGVAGSIVSGGLGLLGVLSGPISAVSGTVAGVSSTVASTVAAVFSTTFLVSLQHLFTSKVSAFSHDARIPYMLLLFCMSLFAAILQFATPSFSSSLWSYVPTSLLTSSTLSPLSGSDFVYRICFCLSIFFLLHAVTMLVNGCIRFIVLGPVAKLFAFVAVLVGSLVMPAEFFDHFAQIAGVAAGAYMLLQIYIIREVAFHWAEDWLAREWLAPILLVSFPLLIGSLSFLGYFMWVFTGSMAYVLCAITGLGICVLTIISVTPLGDRGIMPPAIMAAFCTYLCYSALMTDPTQSRPPVVPPTSSEGAIPPPTPTPSSSSLTKAHVWDLIFDMLFVVICTVYACIQGEQKADQAEGEVDEASVTEEETQRVQTLHMLFFVVCTCASCYICSVLTGSTYSPSATSSSTLSLCLKIGGLICSLLYFAWSLLYNFLFSDETSW